MFDNRPRHSADIKQEDIHKMLICLWHSDDILS